MVPACWLAGWPAASPLPALAAGRCLQAIGAQLLTALEQLHREGFVHRDVKPANFVLSPPGASPTEGSWVLIDFGLARKYVEEGQVLPERPDASFRGSTTYASVPNLEQRDQGRRDDLWSWFYILAELVEGGLPWRADREAAAGPGADGQLPSQPQGGGKEQILASKLQCISDPALLFSAVPCPKVRPDWSSSSRAGRAAHAGAGDRACTVGSYGC